MHDAAAAAWPLIALRPLADARHGWAAMLLEAPFEHGVLSRLFGELGLYEALGHLSCVIRLSDPSACPDDAADFLPAERICLCLPGAVCADPGRQADLARLRQLGFRLMADGLPPAGGDFADTVQAVALAAPAGPLPAAAAALLAHRAGPHLALGVERPVDHARCRDLGFGWFAGNYALHPDAVPLPASIAHQTLLLRLLGLVAVDAEARELEELFKQDAHLSYQLLRLVNSVAFSLSAKITSFGQAISLLGRRQLQRWLQLLMYARQPDADTNPLMPRAALRAALMEALCAHGGGRELRDQAFMVGMFSLLEQLLHMTPERIVAPLNLADDVAAALVKRQGLLGRLLRVVETAETGTLPELAAAIDGAGIDGEQWAESLTRACRWAVQVSQEA